MELILNEIRNEIKEVSSKEKIDTGKLNELLQIYRRVEAYTLTSVDQISQINPAFDRDRFGEQPIFPSVIPMRNETATLYDGLIKAFQEMYKSQTPDVAGNRIGKLIDWYKFLDEKLSVHSFDVKGNEIFEDEYIIEKAKPIRKRLHEKILREIEKELDETNKPTGKRF